MHLNLYIILLFTFLTAIIADDRNHKKRQIYREQVLPHAGGKIPETAFETDRLFLNHLQREGIAVPDGIVLEQRTPQVYQYYNKPSRTVFRIALSSDGRYIPKEGTYQHQEVPSVETTYLYPQIHGQKINFKPQKPAYPVYRQIQLHNPQLNQVKFQPKIKAHPLSITPNNNNKNYPKTYKTEGYQNFNIINTPLTVPSAIKVDLPSYSSSHLFSEFDDLFNNFNLHETGNPF